MAYLLCLLRKEFVYSDYILLSFNKNIIIIIFRDKLLCLNIIYDKFTLVNMTIFCTTNFSLLTSTVISITVNN